MPRDGTRHKVEYTGYQNPADRSPAVSTGFQKVTLHHPEQRTNPQGCCPKSQGAASEKRPRQQLADARYSRRPIRLLALLKYRGNKLPVEIFCPTHALFEQRPNTHLHVPRLPGLSARSLLAPREDFITEAREVWATNTTTRKVDYVSQTIEKVIITAGDHGDFMQRPHSHSD